MIEYFKGSVKEADVPTVLYWCLIPLVAIVFPVWKMYTGVLTIDDKVVDIPGWMYIVGIVVWNVWMVVVMVCIAAIASVFAKIGQWVYEGK